MDIGIAIPTPKQKHHMSFRNLKSASPLALYAPIASHITAPCVKTPQNLSPNTINNTLSFCLDQLAPVKTKTVSFTKSEHTSELHLMKLPQMQDRQTP